MASITVAEERQQQKEDIEDIQEDRRREQGRLPDVSSVPKTLEVVRRQAREDHETDDGVDQRAVRDPDEDRHDSEDDQRDQRPEEGTRNPGEIAAVA